MNTRRGFFARFGLAIVAIIAAPKMAFQTNPKVQPPFMFDPTQYMGELKWAEISRWSNILKAQEFPANQGLTTRAVYSKV